MTQQRTGHTLTTFSGDDACQPCYEARKAFNRREISMGQETKVYDEHDAQREVVRAAAPAMLQALEEITRGCVGCDLTPPSVMSHRCDDPHGHMQARAAIQQARTEPKSCVCYPPAPIQHGGMTTA